MIQLKRNLLSTTVLPAVVGAGAVLAIGFAAVPCSRGAGNRTYASVAAENPEAVPMPSDLSGANAGCCAAACSACNACAACNPCNPCAAAEVPCCAGCNPCCAACDAAEENGCGASLLVEATGWNAGCCAAACSACNACAAACAACNPCAAVLDPCNPCAAVNPCNPCATCNPCCAAATGCGASLVVSTTGSNAGCCAAACSACNACAAACAACNPCAAVLDPCNPCAAVNPCNPCATCNPCCAAATGCGAWLEPAGDEDRVAANCLRGAVQAAYGTTGVAPGSADGLDDSDFGIVAQGYGVVPQDGAALFMSARFRTT